MKDLHLGEELRIAMRLDERELVGRKLLLDDDRLVLGARPEAEDLGLEIVVIEMKPVGDRTQMLRFEVLSREQDAVGGVIVDDHAPVAIENLSPWRDDRDGLDPVGLGALAIDIGIANLQIPKPGDEKNENPHDSVLEKGDLFTREFGIVPKDRLVWNALRLIGFDG